jgi:hypothetical protein
MTLPGRLPGVLGAPLGVPAADVRIDNLRALRHDAFTPYERRALILHLGQPGRGYTQQAQIQAAAAALRGDTDYRMGNLLVDGTDLTRVLDRESVHVGEASEELAWFCMRPRRFGGPTALGAGGLGSIESFLDGYEEASGAAVDRVGFHWWRIMTTLFRGVMCLEQAHMWLKRKVQRMPSAFQSLQFAIVGRRVCESEWDLLNLIEGTK